MVMLLGAYLSEPYMVFDSRSQGWFERTSDVAQESIDQTQSSYAAVLSSG